MSLSNLGFYENDYKLFQSIIKRPNGIFLITGPTGSGKTTTLYAAISELNKPNTKIITAENPVEYVIPGINQSEVNEKIGFVFQEGALFDSMTVADNVAYRLLEDRVEPDAIEPSVREHAVDARGDVAHDVVQIAGLEVGRERLRAPITAAEQEFGGPEDAQLFDEQEDR